MHLSGPVWLRTRSALLVITCLLGVSSSSICEVACSLSGPNSAFYPTHSPTRQTALNGERASGIHSHCAGPGPFQPVEGRARVIRSALTCAGSCCQQTSARLYPKKLFDRTNRDGSNETFATLSWESPLSSSIIDTYRERSRVCLRPPVCSSSTLRI